ncbi:MAG: hypothetical protein KatS3mg109_0153 [Pirellulaceae bacterium]|nr:MAG: hypothetical protein KatS3mg109_0153 [Pirellulaceae bacterium]
MRKRKWQLCLVAANHSVRSIAKAAKHLVSDLDFDDAGVFCVCGKGEAVPDLPYIAKHRVNRALTPAETWAEAIQIMSQTYAPTSEMMLFTTPDYRFWKKLKLFCDYTVQPNEYGVYSLYTPQNYFFDEPHRQLPCESTQAGWCGFDFNAVANNCEAMLMHRHSARLISAYLHDMMSKDLGLEGEWSWPDLFQTCIGGIYNIPCYAAMPSFAKRIRNDNSLFVGDYSQKGVDIRKNRYLAKPNAEFNRAS